MDEGQRKVRVIIGALITVFLWSSSYSAVRFVLNYYTPESLLVLRFSMASLTMAIIALVKKVRLPAKADLPMFALAGLLGFFIYHWLFNRGTSMVIVGVASFLIAASPVFTTLLSIFLLKEKVNFFAWLGILVSFGGIGFISLSQVTDFELNFGIVFLIAACVCTSLYFIVQRHLLKTYSFIEATAYPIFFGTAMMWIFFMPRFLLDVLYAPIEVNLVGAYLGVFPAAIAYLSWGYTLSQAKKTTEATIYLYLIPFFASLIAYFWLGEVLTPLIVFGGSLVISGMFITNKWGR